MMASLTRRRCPVWFFSSMTRCGFAAVLLGSVACNESRLPTGPAAPAAPILSVEAGGAEFTSVSAGNDHTCGVTGSGAAYCWGYNLDGELGNGRNTISRVPVAGFGGL